MLLFFQNVKTEYNYVNVLPNIFMPLSLIAQSNLIYYFFSKISTSDWNNAWVTARFFLQQLTVLSNWCVFALTNNLAGIFIIRYWVRAKEVLAYALLGSACGTSAHRRIMVFYLSILLFLTRGGLRGGASSPFWFTLWSIQVFLVTSQPWIT